MDNVSPSVSAIVATTNVEDLISKRLEIGSGQLRRVCTRRVDLVYV